MQLNINTDAAVIFTDKLERIGKNALPNAIRETLSKAALDVKKNTMPVMATKEFVNRTKTFFKANSVVDFARGRDINTMQATVGFFDNKLKNQSTNYAVKDLEQQEYGGKIGGKSFIPTKDARIGRSANRNVRANARISDLRKRKIFNVRNAEGANWSQRAIKTAFHAKVGGLILISSGRAGGIYKIKSISRSGGNTRFEKTKLYSYRKNRSVKVNRKPFMESAATLTQKKIDDIYAVEAQKQINRILGR